MKKAPNKLHLMKFENSKSKEKTFKPFRGGRNVTYEGEQVKMPPSLEGGGSGTAFELPRKRPLTWHSVVSPVIDEMVNAGV